MIFRRRTIVLLILIAFSNLIALQNQYVICKESSGKISIESYSNKCCDKKEFLCCNVIQDSKSQFTSTKQAHTCTDTQLVISAFSKENLVKDTVKQLSCFSFENNQFALNSFTRKYPTKSNSLNLQNQNCISSTVLLI